MTETLQRKFLKPTSISESLKCIICSDVYMQATRLFCSHTFCFVCIQNVLKASGNCPMCRTKIDKKNWGPDRIAQNIIAELQVFCPVDDCPWKGPNSKLETHYDFECEMKNKVSKAGKSHKKMKIFNIDMIKDEQVQEKINVNVNKGSLEARLQVARRKNNPRQNNEVFNNNNQNKFKQQKKEEQSKNNGNYDFLEELFE